MANRSTKYQYKKRVLKLVLKTQKERKKQERDKNGK